MQKDKLISDTVKMVLMLLIVVLIACYTFYKQKTNMRASTEETQKVKAE